MPLDKKTIKKIIKSALTEDIGPGDITTSSVVALGSAARAVIIAKEDGVLCGIDITKEVFKFLNYRIKFKAYKRDRDSFRRGEHIAAIYGNARSIVTAERVALNFLSHLSGIAKYTKKFTEKIKGFKTKILDTRKTTPGLRPLEKYAVRVGGGKNHRMGLWDWILIKDNHLRASGIIKGNTIDENKLKHFIESSKKKTKHVLEIEVENLNQFKKIVKYRPHIIMLDNFSTRSLKKAVKWRNKYFPSVKLEASGNVTLSRIRKIASSGVDFVSAGTITHSPHSTDISLEIIDE